MRVVRIKLLENEIRWTDEHVGRKRQANAILQNRTPAYGQPPENCAADHILGARCEAAAYKWAKPVKWHWNHFDLDKRPDLDDFIDVKGVDSPNKNLLLRNSSVSHWAYLLIDGSNHPLYDIVGWTWGYEAMALLQQTRGTGRQPAWFVDRDNPLLKEPESLLAILRQHQGERKGETADREGEERN